MKLEIFRQIFEKHSNINFHENPSIGAEMFHADRGTDMMELTIAFRSFANAPKNPESSHTNTYKISENLPLCS